MNKLITKQCHSSNPKVKVFQVLMVTALGEAFVGLAIEEDRSTENGSTTSDWRIVRKENYGMVKRLLNRTVDEMVLAVEELNPGIFLEDREYSYIQIDTGLGQTVYLHSSDDYRVLSHVYKTIMRGTESKRMINDQNFIDFVRKELFEQGDWPVRVGAVRDNSEHFMEVKSFDPPKLYM